MPPTAYHYDNNPNHMNQIHPASMEVKKQTSTASNTPTKACVILLHGLNRSSDSLAKMARSLEAQGYTVWNKSYPSRERPIAELAKISIEPALAFCEERGIEQIHFVTHSLGGILVRYYLQDNAIPKLGRIVMLAPPNRGSEIVDKLKTYKIYQLFNGPAGQQLGTDANSIPNQHQPIDGEIGVIIGNSTSDPWFSWLIPGEDDGKVSVASARLDEMTDFLVVSEGHTFIMQKDAVIAQVQTFLLQGRFDHTES